MDVTLGSPRPTRNSNHPSDDDGTFGPVPTTPQHDPSHRADLDRILTPSLQEMLRLTGAERAFILLVDPDEGLHIRDAAHRSQHRIARPEGEVDWATIRHVLERGNAVRNTESFNDDAGCSPDAPSDRQARWSLCVPIDAGGERLGAVIVDRIEAEGRFTADDLQHLHAHADRLALEIANATLRARLAEAGRLQEEFLSNVSHELRTPLGGIVACSELLQEDELTASQTFAVRIIDGYARRLVGLVDDLLDLSGTGMLPADPEQTSFNLRQQIETAGENARREAAAKGLRFEMHVDPDAPEFVVGQPRRLTRILRHLLGNAVKFTERGNVAIEVTVLVSRADSVSLQITVDDTGIGVPEWQQEQIFEAFVQGDGSTTRRFGGAGVGLAICARAVTAMGGHLEMESTEDAGSTFTLTVDLDLPPGGAGQPDGASRR